MLQAQRLSKSFGRLRALDELKSDFVALVSHELRAPLTNLSGGIELIADDSYILECGFERLNGVDFRKGCCVGQEVTARMKHKTDLRKGLARVTVRGNAAPGTAITTGDKPVGTLFTRSGDRAIAYLRFDRAEGPMQAGAAEVRADMQKAAP